MGGAHHCSEMTYTVSSGTLNPTIPWNHQGLGEGDEHPPMLS